jgi:hypothetical protein
MKDYGKRLIPRNPYEFVDLILPFVRSEELSKAVDVLYRYSIKKKQNPKSHFETAPLLIYMAFHSNLEISIQTICEHFFVFIQGIPEELNNQVMEQADNELIRKHGSVQNLLTKYLRNVEIDDFRCDIDKEYHSIDILSAMISDYGSYSKSWQFGIKNNRQDICGIYLLEAELKDLLSVANNKIREIRGLKPISSKWKSEQMLFDRIKLAFPEFAVIGQGSPDWLGEQRFDIWLPKCAVAIEYNGKQHYEAIGYFGGEVGLQKTMERDELKKQKCIENRTTLIIVDEGYDFEELVSQIEEIIESFNSWRN